ncbi:hypothetical protein [Arthrobacter methylotrophus]|uniref:hypothetical protein n=1 Tax=Arthrobacter methylotrophus TaxID=121291 RepID=UPI0031E7CE3B
MWLARARNVLRTHSFHKKCNGSGLGDHTGNNSCLKATVDRTRLVPPTHRRFEAVLAESPARIARP